MDLITFGEALIRLSPPAHYRLAQAPYFDYQIGGAEVNVAINLASLGAQVAWFSRLPINPMGEMVVRHLRQYGIDTSGITWAEGERLGLYFMEAGAEPRPAQVWYDRADSAICRISSEDLPLSLMESARWLHLTGITAALSQNCQNTLHAAIQHARRAGLKISFDVNYRALLWSPEAARAILTPLCQAADVVFIARRDAAKVFGQGGDIQPVLRALQADWGQSSIICSDGAQSLYALDQDGNFISQPTFPVPNLVDRIGAGDALASGVLYGLLNGYTLADSLRIGAGLAALKLTIVGDVAAVTFAEVERLLKGHGGVIHR